MPYESSFQCPGGYNGICESIDDAYHDSVNGIDARQFDEKWKEHKADWEESHAELIAARKSISAIDKASGTVSTGQKPVSYRESYLRKMKDLIDAPETPVLVPPKVIRILVLPRTYEQRRSLVGSHYLFSQLEDGPRWILRKIPEVPEPCLWEDKENISGVGAGFFNANRK
jgi:conjugal transfer pilus assembly protein TraV